MTFLSGGNSVFSTQLEHYERLLFGACAGIVRQEIDNLMRVDYLAFRVPCLDRDEFCKNALSGNRWKKQNQRGKFVPIADVDFHTLAADNHSWVSLAYEYTSKFIHLTNFWEYQNSDPVVSMPSEDRSKMINYLNEYHNFNGDSLTMDKLVEYLPLVFEKIRSNVALYVLEDEGLLLAEI